MLTVHDRYYLTIKLTTNFSRAIKQVFYFTQIFAILIRSVTDSMVGIYYVVTEKACKTITLLLQLLESYLGYFEPLETLEGISNLTSFIYSLGIIDQTPLFELIFVSKGVVVLKQLRSIFRASFYLKAIKKS